MVSCLSYVLWYIICCLHNLLIHGQLECFYCEVNVIVVLSFNGFVFYYDVNFSKIFLIFFWENWNMFGFKIFFFESEVMISLKTLLWLSKRYLLVGFLLEFFVMQGYIFLCVAICILWHRCCWVGELPLFVAWSF